MDWRVIVVATASLYKRCLAAAAAVGSYEKSLLYRRCVKNNALTTNELDSMYLVGHPQQPN